MFRSRARRTPRKVGAPGQRRPDCAGRRAAAGCAQTILVTLLCLATLEAVSGEDDRLKEGAETPRHPDYVHEEELPRTTAIVPGASAGVFYGRHDYGDMFMGRWRPEYLNLGWKDYENYRLNTTPYLKTYDTFGNFVLEGYEIFSLQEYRTRSSAPASLGRKGQFYQNWLRHLIIADDSYGSWSSRLMVGDYIHTTFTPLTLDMVGFNGVRFDAISAANNKLTLLVSRISDPIKMRLSGRTDLGRQGSRRNVNDGVYLMGGHWEYSLDDAITLGATYVNLHRFDGLRGVKSNSRKGLVPQNTVPREIIVRFEDDSPEDQRGGAAVFDLFATATLSPSVDAAGEERTTTTLRPTSTEMSPGVIQRARHLEANGFYRDEDGIDRPVYIDYTFDVSESTEKLEFAAAVANDYRISMRQKHFRITNPARGSGENRETVFATIRRAENNVSDMSNRQMVRFDYGLATGVEVMGLNAKVSLPGLEIHGEIARSNNYFQYPTILGDRSGFDDIARYVTVNKEWSRFSAGGEWFSIGPKFTSYNPHPSDSEAPVGETFFFNDPRQGFYRNFNVLTSNPFYALVDDNDNMLYSETVDNWLVQGTPTETNSGATGIFPFFDLDQDGHNDTNRNRNRFPDYDEAFLIYFSDPTEFYFGDDFNNNSIADAWEDDELPNYPYYKDERGTHVLGAVRPMRGLKLTVGRYRVDQIAASGGSGVRYGRLDFARRYGPGLELDWNHVSKDVRDDIPNDYIQYLLREGVGGYTANAFEDQLLARDSFINRGLMKAVYRPRRNWSVEAKLRYELNHQRRTEFQREDDIDFLGAVVRSGYSHRWGDLEIMPRIKFLYRFRERDSQGAPTIENYQFVPILRADYTVTEQSKIRFGLQGFPGLVDRRKDLVNKANDADRSSWTVMWFSESTYEGYRIGTEIGVLREDINFDDPDRPDAQFTRFFIRMISAVGGVVR